MIKQYLQTLLLNTEELDNAVEKFAFYRDLLLLWNQKFNLTSITDPTEIDIKHFIDSLLAADYMKGNVLDVGAGAGFPSLPLKILLPQLDFTLVDSLNKRVTFLNEVIAKLNLTHIRAVHARAEELPKNKLYDTVVARAVAPMNVLCEYCLPFVKRGGFFVCYKSFDCEEEINQSKAAVKILGGKIRSVEDKVLFGTDIVRKIILIEKINPTPALYPRLKNKPRLDPLI